MNPYQTVSFSTNKKNNKLLVIRGQYTLTKDGKTNQNGTSRWKCTNRDNCTATATLTEGDHEIIRETKHTCTPDINKIKITQLIDEIKQEVCINLFPIQQIYEGMVEKFIGNNDLFPVTDIPSFTSLKSTLYRTRKNFLGTKSLVFKTVQDVQIPKGLPENVVVYEDQDLEKIIILCSQAALAAIKSSELCSYSGDGTFKACPRPFSQLYIFHLDVFSDPTTVNIFPVIYALLPNKTENTYRRLFHLIKEKLDVVVKSFKCDYEAAQINAVKAIFPDAKLSGCYQHFNKAVWKKAKACKIARVTRPTSDDKRARGIVRLCSNFVLLPPSFMHQAWISITQCAPSTPKMKSFLKYFKAQWYEKDHRLISCAEDTHRTTNNCEGYHRRINARLPRNPNLYLVFSTLLKEIVHYDRKIANYLLFVPFKKNRRTRDILFDRKYVSLLKKLNLKLISPKDFLLKINFIRLKLAF